MKNNSVHNEPAYLRCDVIGAYECSRHIPYLYTCGVDLGFFERDLVRRGQCYGVWGWKFPCTKLRQGSGDCTPEAGI